MRAGGEVGGDTFCFLTNLRMTSLRVETFGMKEHMTRMCVGEREERREHIWEGGREGGREE